MDTSDIEPGVVVSYDDGDEREVVLFDVEATEERTEMLFTAMLSVGSDGEPFVKSVESQSPEAFVSFANSYGADVVGTYPGVANIEVDSAYRIDDHCGAETTDGTACQNPATGENGRCWIDSHQH